MELMIENAHVSSQLCCSRLDLNVLVNEEMQPNETSKAKMKTKRKMKSWKMFIAVADCPSARTMLAAQPARVFYFSKWNFHEANNFLRNFKFAWHSNGQLNILLRRSAAGKKHAFARSPYAVICQNDYHPFIQLLFIFEIKCIYTILKFCSFAFAISLALGGRMRRIWKMSRWIRDNFKAISMFFFPCPINPHTDTTTFNWHKFFGIMEIIWVFLFALSMHQMCMDASPCEGRIFTFNWNTRKTENH